HTAELAFSNSLGNQIAEHDAPELFQPTRKPAWIDWASSALSVFLTGKARCAQAKSLVRASPQEAVRARQRHAVEVQEQSAGRP
ncbi:MAG: hypothetical protein ACRD4I_13060, partial [Candidatus Angelobacter sp.]